MNLVAAGLHEGIMGEIWAKSNILPTPRYKTDENKTVDECWLNSFRKQLLSCSGKSPFTQGNVHLF